MFKFLVGSRLFLCGEYGKIKKQYKVNFQNRNTPVYFISKLEKEFVINIAFGEKFLVIHAEGNRIFIVYSQENI